MIINNNHLMGAAVGVGICTIGFYFYLKNQRLVNEFLSKHGLSIPCVPAKDYSTMTIEELVAEKERLEDLIAERELSVVKCD